MDKVNPIPNPGAIPDLEKGVDDIAIDVETTRTSDTGTGTAVQTSREVAGETTPAERKLKKKAKKTMPPVGAIDYETRSCEIPRLLLTRSFC